MNMLERASFERLMCQPDIDLDFNTEAYLSDLFGLAKELKSQYYKR